MREIEKSVRRVVTDVAISVKCDRCGKIADDYGTSASPVDWKENIRINEGSYDIHEETRTHMTTCWLMEDKGDTYEAILCPSCFKVILKDYMRKS